MLINPIVLVNRYDLLDFALNDEELLKNIVDTVRAARGNVTRRLKSLGYAKIVSVQYGLCRIRPAFVICSQNCIVPPLID